MNKNLTKAENQRLGETTHDDYWDCECSDNKPYIHAKKKGNFCPTCNTYEEDGMPDSRVIEIHELYDPKKDKAIHRKIVIQL